MKSIHLLTLGVCLISPLSLQAQNTNPPSTAPLKEAVQKHRGNFEASRQKFIQRFDTDGDGKLSKSELAAVKQAMQERRNRIQNTQKENPETNQDRKQNIQEEILKRFDKDGDGRLNEQEQAAAQAALKEKRDTTQ